MLSRLLKFFIGDDIGGRYFLTIVSGFCFAYMVITKSMDKDAMVLIGMVFVLYFSRTDRTKQENQPTEVTK